MIKCRIIESLNQVVSLLYLLMIKLLDQDLRQFFLLLKLPQKR